MADNMSCARFAENAAFSFITALLLMGGCTDDRKTSVQGSGAVQQTAGGGEVRLLPENPTVQEDLRILHSSGGQVTYQWYVNGQGMAGEKESMLRRDKFSKGDNVKAVVSLDGKEYSVSAMVLNSPPKIISVTVTDPQVKDADFKIEPKVFDADGDEVRFRFQWAVNGDRLPDEGSAVLRSRFRKGDRVDVSVTPSDPDGDGETYTHETIVVPNSSPRFTSPPMTTFSATGYRYQARAEDPDGDQLTFSLLKAPSGMMIDSNTGIVVWAIDDIRAGEQLVEIVVTDPEGLRSTQQYTLTVTLPKEVKDDKE